MENNNQLLGINFFEITNQQLQNVSDNFKRICPNETNKIWSDTNVLLNIISAYKRDLNLGQDTQVNIEFKTIAYDQDLALNYIRKVFNAYGGTKEEYIHYYNGTGQYSFDENSTDEELAVAIINRISIGFTLKNNENSAERHYDMGRLCPPNCPN